MSDFDPSDYERPAKPECAACAPETQKLRTQVAQLETKLATLQRDHVELDRLKARHQEGIEYMDRAVEHWRVRCEAARAKAAAYRLVVADLSSGLKGDE